MCGKVAAHDRELAAVEREAECHSTLVAAHTQHAARHAGGGDFSQHISQRRPGEHQHQHAGQLAQPHLDPQRWGQSVSQSELGGSQ